MLLLCVLSIIVTPVFFLSIRRPPSSTLSLHDALPIFAHERLRVVARLAETVGEPLHVVVRRLIGDELAQYVRHQDRKSTRLNSSHVKISYAVFCLKKKKT